MLDRVAQKVVLDNIKAQLRFNRAQLVRDIASYAETELESYLERSGNEVKTIYRSTRDSWTGYLRQAGLIEGLSPLETVLRGELEELSDAEEKKLLLPRWRSEGVQEQGDFTSIETNDLGMYDWAGIGTISQL